MVYRENPINIDNLIIIKPPKTHRTIPSGKVVPRAPFEIVVVVVLLGRWKGPLDHEAKAWRLVRPNGEGEWN